MVGVPLADSRRWVAEGTDLFLGALDRTDDANLSAGTVLPGWTGRHLVAHVAANAEALVNLVTWARTGVETPMYDSPDQRDADIQAGGTREPSELREWVLASAKELDAALDTLDHEQWRHQVRTAQGRTVPAAEVPWMRTREVMVHAVDLGAGVGFEDLPKGFLLALVDDVLTKRSKGGDGPALRLTATDDDATWELPGTDPVTDVSGSLAGVAAYLTGRPGPTVVAGGDTAPPTLPRWL